MLTRDSKTQQKIHIRPLHYGDLDAIERLCAEQGPEHRSCSMVQGEALTLSPWRKLLGWLPLPWQKPLSYYVADFESRVQGVIRVSPFNRAQTTWRIDQIAAESFLCGRSQLDTKAVEEATLVSASDVGSELMRHCLEKIWQARTWVLELDVSDLDALALYRQNGFQLLAKMTYWSLPSEQLQELAAREPDLPNLRSVSNADAPLLYQLDNMAMPPLVRQVFDRHPHKGARVLRIEAIAHNIKGLRCGKSVEKLPIMLAELQRMVIDFLNVVQAAHCSFLPDGILDTLAAPTQRGERRLAGVDMQKPRMRAVSEALLALAPKPGGFTLAELAGKVRALFPESPLDYAPRHASYDLSKLRGKALVERVDRSRRYLIPQRGIRILGGMLILREKVIKPVLSGLGKLRVGRPPKNIHPLDQHYMNLQQEMRHTLETLALAS